MPRVVECAPESNHFELALFWGTAISVFDNEPPYLPLEAVGARGVASFQEAGGGGPAGRVLPRRRLFRLDPRLASAKRPVDGQQGGVAAAPDV